MVTRRMAGEDYRQPSAGLAQGADTAQRVDRRTRDSRKQASPGQHDSHAVASTGEHTGQCLDCGANEHEVVHAITNAAVGEFPKGRRTRVHADEEAIRLRPRPLEGQTTVARSQVDRHPPREVL
jgi:hypothetical protein